MTQTKNLIKLATKEQRAAVSILNHFAGMYDKGLLCRDCKNGTKWRAEQFKDCMGCGIFRHGRDAMSFMYDQKVKRIENKSV